MESPDKEQKDALRLKVEDLMLSPVALIGDYRLPEYKELVDEAISILSKRHIGKRHKQLYFASCCKAWGQRCHLKDKGHPEYNIQKAAGKLSLQVDSGSDLKKRITGGLPSPGKPWIVQFPRGLCKCFETPIDPQNLENRVLKEQPYMVFRRTEYLGKRAIEELDYPQPIEEPIAPVFGKLL